MGIRTEVEIEIAATPAEVFEYLVDPEKLEAWYGSGETMPADRSRLRVGYAVEGEMAMPLDIDPGHKRGYRFEITGYDPPKLLAFELTYRGGESESVYELEAGGLGTRLRGFDESDWAELPLVDEVMEMEQVREQPAWVRKHLRNVIPAQLERGRTEIDAGAWDRGMQPKMQAAFEDTVRKLKRAVEEGVSAGRAA